jgi:hypothetical protein
MATALLRDPFVPIDAGTHGEIENVLRRVGIDDPTHVLKF